tara:strand:+ start:4684 stop:5223 length:540 start_codon:yes stop_codon:yes gene_type:complete
MNRKDLFPYANRTLGTQSLIFDKLERRNPEHLAMITLVNLKAGDFIVLEGKQFDVTEANDSTIKIKGSIELVITKDSLCDNALHAEICKTIGRDPTARVEPIEHIIERDPALFRARVGGWVLIDELVSLAGNAQYPSSEDLRQIKQALENKSKVTDKEKVARSKSSKPPKKSVQLGFDF